MMRSVLLLCLTSSCYARGVQKQGARPWELKNSATQRAGAMNDAELGMANLKQAMHDPSLLASIAQELRLPEGRAELVKMMASSSFQQQMKTLIEENGAVADFLTPGFYAAEQKAKDSTAP